MADYRQALQALSRVPLANFVAERERLAAELRAAGDEDAARQLAQRRRPTASAWTVNQLYWHARGTFDALLAAAGEIRKGDLRETSAYREALGELRKRAAAVLQDAAHAASAATLSRVMGTLAAVAAAGGFDPDPPGALATDRKPPGFDAFDEPAAVAEHQPTRGSQRQRATVARTAASEREHLAAARAEERAQKQAEAKAREAERRRLKTALVDANAEVRARERALALLQKELQAAEKAVEDAREVVRDLERKFEVFDDAD
jgi:hypothetical protein